MSQGKEELIDKREVFLSEPVLTDAEIVALKDVIESGWITMGDRVHEFEKAFAEFHDTEDGVAVSSCTAGLHLVLEALGVSKNDEVLAPSLTFVASANAIRYTGAMPKFVDIESTTKPLICVSAAEELVNRSTKAVIVVHYGGWLCDMEAWRSFADKHNLLLIEDAAHAPGDARVGKLSDAAVFSFYGNKNMTTAEGGLIIAEDPELRARIRRLRSHGMTSLTLDRRTGHAYSYDVTHLGFNYRMDELRAALGLSQLNGLSEWNRKRNTLLGYYQGLLMNRDDGIELPFAGDRDTIAHLCPILLPQGSTREKIMKKLREHGVHSSIHYPPTHKFSYYQDTLGDQQLKNTEEYAFRELSLPIHPAMSESDVEYVVQSLKKCL